MIEKFGSVLMISLLAYCLSAFLYPLCIRLLRHLHIKKTIRLHDATGQESSIFASLHGHKSGTPTMGGVMFLLMVVLFMVISAIARYHGWVNYDFFNTRETGLLLVGFFGMGIIGLIDDVFNILKMNAVRGLAAWPKLGMMFLFAGFIAYWFVRKLDIYTLNIWPLGGEIVMPMMVAWVVYFVFILFVTNAINITDGLDGLAGGLLMQIFSIIAVVAFFDGKFLTSSLLAVVLATIGGFLWHNIYPAKIFMGDSGSFSLGGLLSVSILLLNIERGVFIPFLLMFALFVTDAGSSLLQIFWKKWKKQKLFAIAPIHHLLEHRGMHESTIVMKWWLIQAGLNAAALILFLYQFRVL